MQQLKPYIVRNRSGVGRTVYGVGTVQNRIPGGAVSKDDKNNPDPLRTIRLLWDPPPPPTRGPKARLSVEQIVTAAIQLADEQGTDALSMRQLANQLGAGTMSLYTYVSSKAELLELMVDHVYAEIRRPEEQLDWRGQVFGLALQHWQLYERHPWILQSNLVRLALGPNYLDAAEHLYGALESHGLTPEDIVQAARLIDHYVHGAARSTLLEQQASHEAGVSTSEFHSAREEFWQRYFDLDRYPVHTRLWTFGGLSDKRDPFEFGLNRLLDSIELLKASSS